MLDIMDNHKSRLKHLSIIRGIYGLSFIPDNKELATIQNRCNRFEFLEQFAKNKEPTNRIRKRRDFFG